MQLLRDLNMNTTDEFIKALQEILTVPDIKIEYRLYYDETGGIITCSQTNHQPQGNYIVVTEDEYNHYYQYCIKNGKLKKIDNNPNYRVQLTCSTKGYCVVKNHAGIILENELYPNVEYYESN